MYADACHKAGAGVFGDQWIRIPYPTEWKTRGITYLELYPLVVLAHMFAAQLSGSKVIFHMDNYAAMLILNSKTSKQAYIMALIRKLVLTSLQYNFDIVAHFVPGKQDTLPDLLSRFQENCHILKAFCLSLCPTTILQTWRPHIWMTLKDNF